MDEIPSEIDELAQYLIKYGYDKNIASQISNSYTIGGIEGVIVYVKYVMNNERHNYIREITSVVMEWRKEISQ